MPAEPSRRGLSRALGEVRASLPAGFVLAARVDADGLLIRRMRAPIQGRGQGSQVLTALLRVADHHGQPTRLYADPTLEGDDPDLATLVRWYARHGFRVTGRTRDDWVRMDRPVGAEPAPEPGTGAAFGDWLARLPVVEEED